MDTILIIGGSSFIGLHLINELAPNNKIISTYNEHIPEIKNDNILWTHYNLKNNHELKKLLNSLKIDACIYLSWMGNTGSARADNKLQIKNISAMLELINCLKECGITRFIGAGTLAEKDVLNYHLKNGSSPGPNSCYAVSKLSSHLFSKIECNRLQIEHIWCIIANVYGPGDHTSNFVNYAIDTFETDKHAGFTSGEQIYDLVYIDDLVEGIANVIKNGKNNYEYYIGSGSPRPLKEYILDIQNYVAPNKEIFFGEIPFKGKSLKYEDYDISETMSLGYRPKIEFKEGLKRLVDWRKKIKEKI